MVESIKGSGPISGVSQVKPASVTPDKKKSDAVQAEKQKAAKQDEVVISREAISLQQAEKTATETKNLLSNSAFSLGLGSDFSSGQSG